MGGQLCLNAQDMTSNRRAFLKQVGVGAAGLGLLSFVPGCRTSGPLTGAGKLPRSTPEAEGVSPQSILAFLEAVRQRKYELHSFMLVRHGRVVAEGWWSPYGPEFNHTLYSLSKSFTSTAVGFAVTEGRLRVDDRVVSFFPHDLPEQVSEHLAALRVKDLLTMSVGNGTEPTRPMVEQENWVKAFLGWPIPNPSGAQFMYNSSATYMLSAIVQQVTGQRVLDYLQPRLFEPLGIRGATWETCPRGINVGGWGLSIQTEGLAKFGQLYLQKGVWQGRQILPPQWVEEATTFKIQQPLPAKPSRPNDQNDWLQGYCYQFWRCRHNAFRGDGAFGQYMIVMPEQDAVVAITAETSDMQGELDLVWQHLLPAMKPQPLPRNPQSEAELGQTLSSLALTPPTGQPASPLAERISGKTFKLDTNELGLQSASFVFGKDGCRFRLNDSEHEFPVVCGVGQWQRGVTALPGTPPRLISGGAPKSGTQSKVAVSGAWVDQNTFQMVFRYYETPHHDAVTCRFDEGTVQISFMSSLAQMSPTPVDKRAVLKGQLVH
jgi:CubicO group peptidase (beta-lactamase class C family)